jgi:hypothetical protein
MSSDEVRRLQEVFDRKSTEELDLPPQTLPKVKLVQPQVSGLVLAPVVRAV